MTIRPSILAFVDLGVLPPSTASEEVIARHEAALRAIDGPITTAEAALLQGSFGPDDCYGLAWMLLHLIETAPGGAPIAAAPSGDDNEWIRRLWDRAHRAVDEK